MDEQQDAFGGQFFQIGVLYSWWCGIHIQILSITITDGEHTFMWNMKKALDFLVHGMRPDVLNW